MTASKRMSAGCARGGGAATDCAVLDLVSRKKFDQIGESVFNRRFKFSKCGLPCTVKWLEVILIEKLDVIAVGVAGASVDAPPNAVGKDADSVRPASRVLLEVTPNLTVWGIGARTGWGSIEWRSVLLGFQDDSGLARLGVHLTQKTCLIRRVALFVIFGNAVNWRITKRFERRFNKRRASNRFVEQIAHVFDMPNAVTELFGQLRMSIRLNGRHGVLP